MISVACKNSEQWRLESTFRPMKDMKCFSVSKFRGINNLLAVFFFSKFGILLVF